MDDQGHANMAFIKGIAYGLCSIAPGAVLLVYAAVKTGLCVGKGGGLAQNMPYSPLGLNRAILNLFLVTSLLWCLVAAWAVVHLRKCKRVCWNMFTIS